MAIAFAVAAVLAVLGAEGLVRGFRAACLGIGSLTLLLGVVGQSPSTRVVQTSGRIPFVPAWTRTPPGDTSVSTGALLALAGLALLAVGALLPS